MNPSQLTPDDPHCPRASWPSGQEAHRLDARAKHLQLQHPERSYLQCIKLAISESAQPAPRAVAAPAPARPPAALQALVAAAPAAVRPFLEEAARRALESDVVAELESCVGWVRQAGKSTVSLAQVEKATTMASNRASHAVARWTANAKESPTARMTELDGMVLKEGKALVASRAASESAQRLSGR